LPTAYLKFGCTGSCRLRAQEKQIHPFTRLYQLLATKNDVSNACISKGPASSRSIRLTVQLLVQVPCSCRHGIQTSAAIQQNSFRASRRIPLCSRDLGSAAPREQNHTKHPQTSDHIGGQAPANLVSFHVSKCTAVDHRYCVVTAAWSGVAGHLRARNYQSVDTWPQRAPARLEATAGVGAPMMLKYRDIQ
jgi:hypothetical protein